MWSRRIGTYFLGIGFLALLSEGLAQGALPTPSVNISSSAAPSTTEDPVAKIRHLLPKVNFENNTVVNITAQLGSSAFLPCRFVPFEDQKINSDQVSWFRRRDWHILTVGISTYASDSRFSVHHQEDSCNWTLQIRFTTLRDIGTYECQMSSTYGTFSQFVNLNVIVPRAVILSSSDYHVQLGSTIKLVCVVEESLTSPAYIFWYRDRHLINYDERRGGINVTNEFGEEYRSYLTINNATYEDSGNYTCAPASSKPAHTIVFVSSGDKMAAIQRRKSSSNFTGPSRLSIAGALLLVAVVSTTVKRASL